jgi:hypothetical protein
MGCGIEWLGRVESGVLRIGQHYAEWGDPYELSCTVVREGSTLRLLGASSIVGADLLAERPNLRALFLGAGVKRLEWTRRRGSSVRVCRVNLDEKPKVLTAQAR